MLPACSVTCPYCGESVELIADPSAGDQRYVEDCPVCCRPMEVHVRVDETGDASLEVHTGDEH